MKMNRQRGTTLLEAMVVIGMFGLLGVLLASSLRMSLNSSQKVESRSIEGTSLSLFFVNLAREVETSDLKTVAISERGDLLSFGRPGGYYPDGDSLQPAFSQVNVYYYDPAQEAICFADYDVRQGSRPVESPVNLLTSEDLLDPVGSNQWGLADVAEQPSFLNTTYRTEEKVVLRNVVEARFRLNASQTGIELRLRMREENDQERFHDYAFEMPVQDP